MEFSNPEIPEGINVSKVHPLGEFFILALGIIGVMALVVAAISVAAERLAVYVPFGMEQKIVANSIPPDTGDHAGITAYLQGLSDQLARHIELPEGAHYTIHYLDSDIKNAYAALGGHIYIYRGLLELLPSENALTMVIAHEMAHIKHRHPLIAMGRGVVIGLLLMSITGLSGDYFTGQVISDAGLITMLSFNRAQERAADRTALAAVAARYGHVAGADALFSALRKLEADMPLQPPQFLSTHPVSAERLKELEELARKNHWPLNGALTPLQLTRF